MINRLPAAISILGMVLGVSISIVFGINEDIFKGQIKKGLSNSASIQSIEDPVKRAAKFSTEKSKLWRYYQRYHFHATGIGAMSIGLILFLSFLAAPRKQVLVSQYLISVGGFFYPYIWLFAAIFGSTLGRHEAKERFAIFGYMGGLFLIGLILALYLSVRHPKKCTN